MTSRSLEPGRSGAGAEEEPPPRVVARPGGEQAASGEPIGLPGQPECTAGRGSRPHEALTTAQLRAHADELGYSPQGQVRWLSPVQLLRTALQALLASVFSTFTDKRELHRMFPADPLELPADADGGCWVDYTADTGDGFDSTYTVASLLAARELEVSGPADERHTLPRGGLLVLGGDEVYPAASSQRYEDRLKGPLRTALHSDDSQGATAPLVLALPGNHDWYDGLTAFLRVFGQRRRIGGWQTVQGRSYFVMRLPGGWWLAGLDSQLGSEIDDPQLEFFRTQLTERLRPGDGVILCCASPAWAGTPVDARAFDSFHYFERSVVTAPVDPATGRVRPTGAQVRLWLAGDLHHYARYQEEGLPAGPARQMITCGLGGAYLAGTHHLPGQIRLPPAGSTERDHGPAIGYGLATCWPPRSESWRMVPGLLAFSGRGLPFRNPGFWRLASWVHAGLFLALISLLGVIRQQGPIDAVRSAELVEIFELAGQFAIWWAVIAIASAVVYSYRARRLRPPELVVVGLGLQLAVGLAGLAIAVWAVRAVTLPDWFPGGRALPNFLLLALLLVLIAPVAGLVGSYAVALTLALSRARLVADWQFSAQSIDDRKGFLRLRITPEGDLVVYPLGVDKVVRRWHIAGPEESSRPPRRVRPAGVPPRVRLIEDPVVIARTPTASSTHGE